MAGSPATESPLEAAAGASGEHTAKAFELLANETRLAILLALWDAHKGFAGDEVLTFSELRDRVGIRDSGQFNYHLGKLEGQFVSATEEGYRLHPVGRKITRAVIAGVGLKDATLEPTELGMPCPICEAPTAILYQDGRLFQVCTECSGKHEQTDEFPEGTLFTWRLNPAGLANRTAKEVYTAACLEMQHQTLGVIEGVCPECSGGVDCRLEVCDEHDPGEGDICPACGRGPEIVAFYECNVCKFSIGGYPSAYVIQHPAVLSFYYERGVNLQYNLDFEGVKRLLALGESHEQTLESREPLRIRVTVRYQGDELTLLLDEEMRVVEVRD